jgi:hypothetical protein
MVVQLIAERWAFLQPKVDGGPVNGGLSRGAHDGGSGDEMGEDFDLFGSQVVGKECHSDCIVRWGVQKNAEPDCKFKQ